MLIFLVLIFVVTVAWFWLHAVAPSLKDGVVGGWDEHTYRRQAELVATGWRFRDIVTDFFGNKDLHNLPTPERYGWIYLMAAVRWRQEDRASYARMAVASRVAAALLPLAAWWLARGFGAGRVEAFICGLLALTPLSAILSRRALQDGTVALLIVSAAAAVLTLPAWAAVLVLWAALVVKTWSGLAWPALLYLGWWSGRGWDELVLIGLLPPALYVAGFCALDRSWTRWLRFPALAFTFTANPYAVYQSGPLWRPVVDLLLVSPVAVAFTLASACAGDHVGAPTVFAGLLVLPFCFIPAGKNLRLMLAVDIAARIAMVCVCLTHSWVLVVAVVCCQVADRWIARRLVEDGVYDPVTANLTRALGMQP